MITIIIMASSPTPSEDNRRNRNVDTMYSALDRVMGNQEQTYDDFMNGFMFLKKGGLNKVTAGSTSNKPSNQGPSSAKPRLPVDKTNQSQTTTQKTISQPSNELDEEILSEGVTSSRLNSTKVVKTGAVVKFDNYVETDDVEDVDEELSMGGYSASFTQDRPQRTSNIPDIQPSNIDTASNELPALFDGKLTLDDNSTDKLLMNFLADLQNEENEGRNIAAASEDTINDSSDIQAFLNKGRKKKVIKKKEDEVSFSDDETEGVLSLCENSNSADLKVVLKPEELNGIAGSNVNNISEEVNRTARLNVYKDVLMDSEGVIRTTGAERMMDSSDEQALDQHPDILFPGEIENREEVTEIKKETTLDFTATYKDYDSKEVETEATQCSDTVEAFQLDEDFDYDNVILTPKYSAEDMERIRPLMNQLPVMTR